MISDEATAFKYLEAALADQFDNKDVQLDFKGWPKITLRLTGEGYDSTVTSDIAQALVDLQHALNRAYARTVHHTANARSLTAEERRSINFKAKVEKGSSAIEVNLGEFAEKLSLALVGKMSADHIVITVLGLAAIAGSVIAYKAWMATRSEALKVDAEARRAITMNQEETKRHEILAKALSRKDSLAFAEQDFHDVRRELLKSAGDAQGVTMQGVVMQGTDARALATTPRTQSEDVQLNGHYTIDKVDFHNPESFRFSVQSTDGYGQFIATMRPESLNAEQMDRLNSGTWDRKKLYMQINGTRLRGEITTASIVSVEWPKKPQ